MLNKEGEGFRQRGLTFSLRNWPQESPRLFEYRLSPLTERIVFSSGMVIDEILPRSIEEFAYHNHLQTRSYEQVLKEYQQFNSRRLKKVEVLKSLWQNCFKQHKKLRPPNMSKSSNFIKSVESTKGTDIKTTKKIMQKKNSIISVKSISLKKDKGKSKGQDQHRQTQHDYCSNHKVKSGKGSSRKKQVGKKQREARQKTESIAEYYQLRSKKRPKSPEHYDAKLLMQLHEGMNRWAQIDAQHRQQMESATNLTEIQVRRLIKIQNIEKEQLMYEIQSMKSQLTSRKQTAKTQRALKTS